MATKSPDAGHAVPHEKDLTEEQTRLKRNARCPCSGCRGLDPFTALDAYRKKIVTNPEMKKG